MAEVVTPDFPRKGTTRRHTRGRWSWPWVTFTGKFKLTPKKYAYYHKVEWLEYQVSCLRLIILLLVGAVIVPGMLGWGVLGTIVFTATGALTVFLSGRITQPKPVDPEDVAT